ncbi:MAG: dTDP-4-dehydrorhamnose 3,5-epimerase [Porticoccaceae bacterium]|nr:dTDP-4-dehydrorhamnose 3,5-epimerase [Porticoccaceae bacterium]
MNVVETNLPGVLVFEPKVLVDGRGLFLETFREDRFREMGVKETFVQENHSRSTRGVLRGLHYQLNQPQGKLVRVARGEVFDVVVDVRVGSPTFGQWYGTTLDEKSMRMMYVPPGFAHGFVVLSEVADFIYKCTDYYCPASEQGILWSDSDVGVEWPFENTADIVLSKKDVKNPRLKDQPDKLLPVYSAEPGAQST